MTVSGSARSLRAALLLASALGAMPALADEAKAPTAAVSDATSSLEQQFQDPPQSARPRVWWHWMNGNITKDGIAKDLAWMKSVGIGGLQNFDADLMTPQVVDKRLVYMTPEWKEAFAFAASEADRHGLELAIAASPGWSETGGPWVKPEDGLKKVVWSETRVAGGKPFKGTLAPPPSKTGPYQTVAAGGGIEGLITGNKPKEPPVASGDIAVLAFPDTTTSALAPRISVTGSTATADGMSLADDDYSAGLDVARGSPAKPPVVLLTYDKPQTIRSARFFVPNSKSIFTGSAFDATLEASTDGANWSKVATLPVGEVPGTASFTPVTASQFRVVLKPTDPSSALNSLGATAPGVAMSFDIGSMMAQMTAPWSIRLLSLSSQPAVDHAEAKAGFEIEKNYYDLPQVNDGASGVAAVQIIDLTSKLKPDGTLDWTPPKGNWRVLRFGWSLLGTTNHPAPEEATGLEVDKFDGPAVRRYLEHYLGMYKDASGGLIGAHGVRALLTDSIEVGAANWTPKMVAQFKRLRGYDPTPWFPALTGTLIGSRGQSDAFLRDYRQTLADLMASEHYGTVAKVAHENGLKVYGEALEDNRPSLGDDIAMRSHADVPMSALWTYRREDGPKLSYLADMKGAASVA
ncbi:MAG: glycosyl hydrolase, partial [Novosphingobium sp.]